MSLKLIEDRFIEEGNFFAFDAYFSSSSVEVYGVSYSLGNVVTEYLNYDSSDYISGVKQLEQCFENDDDIGFLKCTKELNLIVKEMPLFQQILKDAVFFETPLFSRTTFKSIEEKYIIENNKPIMEKALNKYLNLKNDLYCIKNIYGHLLEEMDKEMQTVTASEKYEKAIQIPQLSEYFEGNGLETTIHNDPSRLYTKFLIRKSLASGELEIFERKIFNRLLDFIYMEFCKALMIQNMPKKCKICGKYFLIENGFKNEYCTRPLKDNPKKTCRDVGAAQSFKMKVSQKPEWKIHQRAYKKYYARFKKGQMTEDEFNKWARNAEHLRGEAEAGRMSIEDLKLILNTP